MSNLLTKIAMPTENWRTFYRSKINLNHQARSSTPQNRLQKLNKLLAWNVDRASILSITCDVQYAS